MAITPPLDVNSLHQLAIEIKQNKSSVRLGVKAMQALGSLLAQPNKTAFLSITQLAAQQNISPSTLTRLVKRLGFQGFADFQRLFRESLTQQSNPFYSTQALKLFDQDTPTFPVSTPLAPKQHFDLLAQKSIQNIESLNQNLPENELLLAAKCIAKAKRVRTHGMRQYSALSQFLCYGLGLIRADVGLLDACGLGAAEGLAQLDKNDVLITASVSPYTKEVVAISEQANKAGLTVISLSDHLLSPLSIAAHYAFLIPCQNHFYSNSISSFFVFAEGLMNQVARELGDSALQALSKREHFLAELHIEIK